MITVTRCPPHPLDENCAPLLHLSRAIKLLAMAPETIPEHCTSGPEVRNSFTLNGVSLGMENFPGSMKTHRWPFLKNHFFLQIYSVSQKQKNFNKAPKVKNSTVLTCQSSTPKANTQSTFLEPFHPMTGNIKQYFRLYSIINNLQRDLAGEGDPEFEQDPVVLHHVPDLEAGLGLHQARVCCGLATVLAQPVQQTFVLPNPAQSGVGEY